MYKIIEEKLVNYVTIEGDSTALVIAHIICDTASDIPEPLPQWVAGSRCDVLENGGSVMILSNSRQWEQVNFYSQGGGGETDDYTDLINKPQINGVTLSGNVSSSTLGIKISGATLSGETLTFN